MGWSLAKALGLNYSPSPSVQRDDEIAPGIPRPSSVLAGMVATRLIQYPEKLKEVTSFHWSWDDRKMRIVRNLGVRDEVIITVSFKGEEYKAFIKSDRDKIAEAFHKAISIRKQKDEIKRKEAAEQQACDIIQELFGKPLEEQTPS